MKRLLWEKRFSGILWAVVLGAAFLMLSMLIVNFVSGIPWYLLSSMLRAAFGVIILMLGTRLYGKTTREILSLHNSKIAMQAGLGFLVFLLCYVAAVYVGCRGISGLTAGLFFARILLQQLTTALYEELNYRFLILEGYFHGNKSVWSRLLYVFVSFSCLWGGSCGDRLEHLRFLSVRGHRIYLCGHLSQVRQHRHSHAVAFHL